MIGLLYLGLHSKKVFLFKRSLVLMHIASPGLKVRIHAPEQCI